MRRSLGVVLTVFASTGLVWLGCGTESEPRSTSERIVRPAKPILCPHPEVAFDGTVERDDKRRFDARTLLGLTKEEAVARARRTGCVVRVASIDGRGVTLTGDQRSNRIDIYLEDGVVVKVTPS
jgi:hypothetical protein